MKFTRYAVTEAVCRECECGHEDGYVSVAHENKRHCEEMERKSALAAGWVIDRGEWVCPDCRADGEQSKETGDE